MKKILKVGLGENFMGRTGELANEVTSSHPLVRGTFFFFIFKKILKFQKYISVLKNFKNTPGRPMGATGPRCNFFLQICNEVHGRKKMKGGMSPPQRATGACRPPQGRQGPFPLYKPWALFLAAIPLPFEPKNSGKKRGVRRIKAAKLCRIPHL